MYQMSRSGPGPAKYQLPSMVGFDKHDVRKERKPMFSMRSKLKTNYNTISPGPQYNLNKVTRDGPPRNPSYSFGLRPKQLSPDNVPGPNEVPSKNRSPAFSFGKLLKESKRDNTPGPNSYVYKLDVYKHRKPAYSMLGRKNPSYASEGPAPNQYHELDRNLTHNRNPKYSMRSNYSIMTDRSSQPGPNAYDLMNLKSGASAPQYSFGIPHSMWNPPMIIPGDNC